MEDNKQMRQKGSSAHSMDDMVDLKNIVNTFLAERYFILALSLLGLLVGIFVSYHKVPQYKANLLIQIENKSNSLGSLGSLG